MSDPVSSRGCSSAAIRVTTHVYLHEATLATQVNISVPVRDPWPPDQPGKSVSDSYDQNLA